MSVWTPSCASIGSHARSKICADFPSARSPAQLELHANVLLDGAWRAKLCDFGASREMAHATMTAVGTPLYAAPEVMRRDVYDESCDVWSFGCVLYPQAG